MGLRARRPALLQLLQVLLLLLQVQLLQLQPSAALAHKSRASTSPPQAAAATATAAAAADFEAASGVASARLVRPHALSEEGAATATGTSQLQQQQQHEQQQQHQRLSQQQLRIHREHADPQELLQQQHHQQGGEHKEGSEKALVASSSSYVQEDSWELSFDRPPERHSALIYHPEYSYGNCNCSKKKSECPPNTTCHEEEGGYGGVYCLCNEGYIFHDGRCKENPCKHVNCHPGTCKADANLNISCVCPEGYTATNTGIYSACKMNDICETNPCGDSRAALDCTPLTPTDYVCTCTAGYEVDKSSGKQKCVSRESKIKCADLPCGAEGLQTCEDTEAGYKCTCKSGYRLVEATVGKRCEFINPCESNVCGPPAAVLSCSATESSYSCQCQTGYKLFTGTHSQFCQVDESSDKYDTYVIAGLGVGGLIVVALFAVALKSRNNAVTSEPLDQPDPNVQGTQTAGALGPQQPQQQQQPMQQHAITPSPSAWA
ncbi:hypothetical protein Efla_000838 [Eimeria flavescens]